MHNRPPPRRSKKAGRSLAPKPHREPTSIQILAGRLITHASRPLTATGQQPFVVSVVCDQLRTPLATLMGRTGFCALLLRALTLTRQEVPWLQDLTVSPDGTLTGFPEIRPPLTAETVRDAQVALLSHLLELLVIFIGEKLTLHLIHDLWPNLTRANPVAAKLLQK